MFIDSKLYNGRPEDKRIEQEEAIYDRLDALNISYTRADHEHADTMEDCKLIEKVLGAKICKNLFLCNRQETDFYLLIMPADKPFKTKYLSSQLECSRLSFASADNLAKYLRTIPGSASALELIFDSTQAVRFIVDKQLLDDEYISGHPGFSTSTVCLKRDDMLKYVKSTNHEITVVDLPVEENY